MPPGLSGNVAAPAFGPPSFGPPATYGAPAGAPAPAHGGVIRWIVTGVAIIVMVGVAVFVVATTSKTTAAPATTTSIAPITVLPPTTFKASDSSFSIDFPYPHGPEDAVPLPEESGFHSVDASDRATEHFVIWSDTGRGYPPPADRVDPFLKRVTESGVEALNAILLDTTFEDFRGRRALNFAIKNQNGTAFGRGLSFFSGDRFFVLVALADPGGQYDFQKFTSSFREGV